MRFNRPPVPEGIVFLCAAAFGVLPVIPLEVRGGGPRMGIILAGRDQQVQMWLLARAIQGRGVMERVGDRQTVPGNGIDQVPHEGHILPMGQLLGQGDFPFFKGHPVRPFVPFCCTKVRVRIVLRPGREVARSFVHEIFPVLSCHIPCLSCIGPPLVLRLPRDIGQPCCRFASPTAVHGAFEVEVCHQTGFLLRRR